MKGARHLHGPAGVGVGEVKKGLGGTTLTINHGAKTGTYRDYSQHRLLLEIAK